MINEYIHPSWGILAKADLAQVRELISSLNDQFDINQFRYLSNGDWTAAFYMEISDPSRDEAAEVLRLHGIVPVYRFDFNRHEYITWQWNGNTWEPDDDPEDILERVGIKMPGWGEPPPPSLSLATIERCAIVVEGSTIEGACSLAREQRPLRIDIGPLGAVIFDPSLDTRFRLWERAPARVFEAIYYPKSNRFEFTIMKGEDCLGTFVPGATRTWDGTPFLDNFEGARTAEEVLDKLGIPRSFLDPLPSEPLPLESTPSTQDDKR